MRIGELSEADFRAAVNGAAEQFKPAGLSIENFSAIVEKDYYVTEALRTIAQAFGDRVIFKGGTSLSKGWGLIERFSEDVDLFIDQRKYPQPLGKGARDRELKRLRDIVGAHPLLPWKDSPFSKEGAKRSDRFAYQQRFPGIGDTVLVEVGTNGGNEPVELRPLRSYLGQFVATRGVADQFEDASSFTMTLLHFRRTFVEKLFAIHSRVELFRRDSAKHPLGSYVRHYYDLLQLSQQEAVQAMLASEEYAAIKVDYDAITREHYPDQYSHPPEFRFALSEALFPSAELSEVIAVQYEQQCQLLCYGPWPTWKQAMQRFEELRSQL